MNRITPEEITSLKPYEVFVFGSKKHGIHKGGAAKIAVENFGAVLGQGYGLQGQSYAIDTMSGFDEMNRYIKEFIEFTKQPDNLNTRFLVTKIGCGIAGYKINSVAYLFKDCLHLPNVYLPKDFLIEIYKFKLYFMQDKLPDVYPSQNNLVRFENTPFGNCTCDLLKNKILSHNRNHFWYKLKL